MVGHIELKGGRFAADFLNLSNHRIGLHFLAVIGQDDIMSLLSKTKGHAFAKTPASACYDRDFHKGRIQFNAFLSQ
jgi:hypothetical protein